MATILVAPALALACWASPAAAAPVDAHSAHLGLRAYRAYLSSTLAKVGAAGRSDDAFVATIGAGCPGVLAPLNSSNDPNQTVLTQFGKEVGVDMVVAAFVPYRRVVATLAVRLERLHWSSPATGRRIRAALAAQRAVFELRPSDLCADASALAANRGPVAATGHDAVPHQLRAQGERGRARRASADAATLPAGERQAARPNREAAGDACRRSPRERRQRKGAQAPRRPRIEDLSAYQEAGPLLAAMRLGWPPFALTRHSPRAVE